ncbi:MAG: hypothetical protein Q8K82_23400 [Gemmatimonadaceae bacterium]|nr:hypothetical protein [Gemmatimonadaceae bacterium]
MELTHLVRQAVLASDCGEDANLFAHELPKDVEPDFGEVLIGVKRHGCPPRVGLHRRGAGQERIGEKARAQSAESLGDSDRVLDERGADDERAGHSLASEHKSLLPIEEREVTRLIHEEVVDERAYASRAASTTSFSLTALLSGPNTIATSFSSAIASAEMTFERGAPMCMRSTVSFPVSRNMGLFLRTSSMRSANDPCDSAMFGTLESSMPSPPRSTGVGMVASKTNGSLTRVMACFTSGRSNNTSCAGGSLLVRS